MRVKDFPFDRFLNYKEEKDKNFEKFLSSKEWTIPVFQNYSGEHMGGLCRRKESSLEAQLDFLYHNMNLKSDLSLSYLEPWLGVGVYANAFGCQYEWLETEAPQIRPIYKNIDELKGIHYPNICNCEVMQLILEMIRYFKEQTGGMLNISLTDTQSPNDTASLILDPCELFAASLEEPEALEPFLNNITRVMMEFTDMQLEAMGVNAVYPGHIMPSSKALKGISVSDDNMAVISPASFQATSLPYNNILSKYYGGIAIHCCGNFIHNVDLLMQTENLFMIDCKAGYAADPTPVDAVKLSSAFMNSNIILKVRTGWDEIEKVRSLIHPGIKLIIQLITSGQIDRRNRQYETGKEIILNVMQQRRS